MFRVKRLKFLLVFLIFVTSLSFAKVQITFWHGLARDPDKSSIDKIVADFMKENPDIDV